MQILTLSYEYPPLGGGGSKVVEGLSAEFARTGHHVDVVTMAYDSLPKYEDADGVRVHRVPCLRRSVDVSHPHEQATYMVSALPKAIRLGKLNKYDILHCHFIIPDGLVALLVSRRLRIPLVVTAHGSDVPGYNPDRFRLLHRLISPVWRSAVRAIDTIACPSRFLEELLLTHEPAATTVTIPNGFNLDKFEATKERTRKILVVTRMLERKGVQDVLRAVAEESFDFEIHVVGTGPYLHALKDLAEQLKLSVTFHGWLDNNSDELKSLFETSAIFALPSHAENFPLVLLEAMAAGMAIVTTDQTGCREVVGDAALLVPPGDHRAIRGALQRLAGDTELRAQLGRKARARIEGLFSWPSVAQQYMSLFENLVSQNQRKAELSGVK